MIRLLLIETSSSLCSVALSEGDRIVGLREQAGRVHAAMTAPFIQELLDGQGLRVGDCDAVAVSMGPGSYTGLRVGASTAKGLCFAADIPLIAVGTLEALAWQARDEGLLPPDARRIIPMQDARRMEVYTAAFSPDVTPLEPVSAQVIGPDSFAAERAEGGVLFIGDGVEKCRGTLQGPGVHFAPQPPRAASLLHPALLRYEKKQFEDVAYFEPFYLKDFVATVSRKNLF